MDLRDIFTEDAKFNVKFKKKHVFFNFSTKNQTAHFIFVPLASLKNSLF